MFCVSVLYAREWFELCVHKLLLFVREGEDGEGRFPGMQTLTTPIPSASITGMDERID
jgi:hypothetical protein